MYHFNKLIAAEIFSARVCHNSVQKIKSDYWRLQARYHVTFALFQFPIAW